MAAPMALIEMARICSMYPNAMLNGEWMRSRRSRTAPTSDPERQPTMPVSPHVC